MKITGFLAIGFFAIMAIAVGFVYFGETESLKAPQIDDSITPVDKVSINPNPNADTIDIEESVELKLENKNYWIDEDGKKHYTIEAFDSPTLEE